MIFQPSLTYNDELEVDNEIDPDLPLSQPEAEQHEINESTKVVKNGEMMAMDVGRPSGKEGKMVTKEVFGQGATF